MVCGEIQSLIQIVSRTASAEVESDVQVQGTASDCTVHHSLSQSGLSGRWLRKVNTSISQELSELSMLPHPEQHLNSFKYNGFIFHLFTLPKVPGLRSCVYPWTQERMYELLWRGRWETLVPTMPKSCRAPRASRTPQQSLDWRPPCRAALLQSVMPKELQPSTESYMSSYFWVIQHFCVYYLYCLFVLSNPLLIWFFQTESSKFQEINLEIYISLCVINIYHIQVSFFF